MLRSHALRCLGLAALVLLPAAAAAQDYPNRPIRLVVPAPAGGAPDAIARLVGQRLGERLGRQVVVDNRGGGNGVIGSELVARAPADGYTLVLGYAGPFGINPGMYAQLPYDPVKDFAPITMLATSQNILVVHPSFAARSVKDLIAMAQAKPGQINYASGGTGQSSHLSMELLMQMAGIRMTHIPYKGAGPALADTVGGQVPLHFLALSPAIPLIKAGKLVPLAVTGTRRVPSLAEVPTVAEAGLPGYEVLTWYAAFAPAATPRDILARLHAETVAVLKSSELAAVFQGHGLEPGGDSAEALGRYLEREIAKWRALIKAGGIKPE
ncbi:MAG: tripartite tricarboxylate transporter substrate binding protein [Burkholderiales bacterium]|nr:tripartite tricarboxylate transporter substrate binding protein [Burkholderiales bacterium]